MPGVPVDQKEALGKAFSILEVHYAKWAADQRPVGKSEDDPDLAGGDGSMVVDGGFIGELVAKLAAGCDPSQPLPDDQNPSPTSGVC